MTRIGLIGLDDLAPHLRAAGFEVTSDPDLKQSAQALRASTLDPVAGPVAVLLLNSARVAGLIPRIYRHVELTVLGTATAPGVEGEGYRTYQLPGTVRDVLKNAGVDGFEAVPDDLELDAAGQLIDSDRAWEEWQPPDPEEDQDEAAGPPSADGPAESTTISPPRRTYTEEEELADDVFGAAQSVQQGLRGGRRRGGLGQVLFALSGSGGVGKSTISLAVATRAAARGKRVILVEYPGQGDLATYLRVGGADLPTMFDAVVDGTDLRAGLISPDALNDARDAGLAKAQFALLQAPSVQEMRTGKITATVLHDLIEAARKICDLVVVDSQIIETDDPRGMLTNLILPELGRGGWAVAIAGLSSAGMANLLRVMTELQEEGINPSHVLSMLSRMPIEADFNADRLVQAFRELSVHIGTAYVDDALQMAMNRGELVADSPVLANLVDTILNRIFDLPVQAPAYDPYAVPAPRRWPWSGLFGTKRGE